MPGLKWTFKLINDTEIPYNRPTNNPIPSFTAPAISVTIVFMNVKFCTVLRTSLNVFEMLKLLKSDYLVTIVTPQKRCV